MTSWSRREFLGVATTLGFAALAGDRAFAQAERAKPTRLILLGTQGGPALAKGARKSPAQVILVNDVPYVIDCGYEVAAQLVKAGVSLNRLRYIFITHHTRIKDQGRIDPRSLLVPHEITQGGPVMEDDNVKVTATRVHHPPTEAFAYRFDAKDRSIVISGDTAYSEELIKLAKGADVLVHEIAYIPLIDRNLAGNPNAAMLKARILAVHTTGEEVGRVATKAGVKRVVVGQDLMEI